jgi:hypothetical protein
MRPHLSSARTVALAAAVLLGATSSAAAQADTTRRDPQRARVPVAKERPAPQAPSSGVPVAKATPPDTATRVSTGEVALPRDSTPARADIPPAGAPRPPLAVAQEPEPPVMRYLFGRSGFFIGAGAGTAVPYGALNDIGYDPGLSISVPLGWHPVGRVFGVRGTLAFDQVKADGPITAGAVPAALGSTSDAEIYAATVDGVLKVMPLGIGSQGRGLSVYVLGGGGVYRFRGFGGTGPLAAALDEAPGTSSATKWGVDAGGGVEWGNGRTAAFVEARWVNVFTGGSRAGNDYLRWVPVVVGFTVR